MRHLFQILMLTAALWGKAHGQQIPVAGFDKCILPYVVSSNFMGTVLVAKEDKVIYKKSFGNAVKEWNTPNSTEGVFHLASVSKPFTAIAILQLEERGKLSVSDRVSRFIPDFVNGDKITIHHLLSHSSGIPNINNFPSYDSMSCFHQTPQTLINAFKNKPAEFVPGSKFQYSNSNYNVLAYIIEKTSGMSYGEYLEKNIFEIVGMKDTFHNGDPKKITPSMTIGYAGKGRREIEKAPYLNWTIKTGNGSVCSTVSDLFSFSQALYTEKILSNASLKKMFTKYLGDTGYGWYIRKDGDEQRIYMSGLSPGFSSYFARYPDKKLTIIVLANLYIPSTREIGMSLAAVALGRKLVYRKLLDQTLVPDEIQEFKGDYLMDSTFFRPGYTLKISEKEGRLSCDFGDLLRDEGDSFLLRSFWSGVVFTRDGERKVNAVVFDGSVGRRIR